MPAPAATAYVLLEDGARFDGIACGADDAAVGEIVFTTSMSGYQEAMTDPSYAGQLLAFTYPQIGNYGVSAEAMESDRVHARAAIMRAAVDREDAPGAERGWLSWLTDCGIPAITDLDTRALVRHLRDRGAMRGGLFPARMTPSRGAGADRRRARHDRPRPRPRGHPDAATVLDPIGASGDSPSGVHIAMIDTGVKLSIVRNLRARGATVDPAPVPRRRRRAAGRPSPTPCSWPTARAIPAALDYVVDTVRESRRQAARLRDLPRPPAAVPGGGA